VQEEFEDSKGVIKSVNRTRADNTMAKRKRTNGQRMIYKNNTLPHVEQELLSLPEHLGSPSVLVAFMLLDL
jgi:hypothetical protein